MRPVLITFFTVLTATSLLVSPPGVPIWVNRLISFVGFSVLVEATIKFAGRGGEWEREQIRHKASREGKVPNPFMNYSPDNFFRLRYVWPGVFLIPIRMAIVVCVLVSITLCGVVGKAIVGSKNLSKPLVGWRRIVPWSITVQVRALLFALGFLWITKTGSHAPKSKAGIVVANHRGLFEALYLLQYDCTMLSSLDNKFPLLGHAMDLRQFMFVNRRSSNSRKETADLLDERAKGAGWPQVILFPEGTTTNGMALVQFRRGAFNPGVPVQPVAFEFPNDIDSSWTFGVHGPMFGMFTIIARLMSSWHNPMHVTYLEPYIPSDAEKADSQLFADNVRMEIAETLRIPVTEYSQDDVALMLEAVKNKMPPADFATGFSHIKALYSMDTKRAKESIQRFAKAATKAAGHVHVDKKHFADVLGLPQGPALDSLFHLLTSGEHSEEINFSEWIAGIGKASSGIKGEDKLEVCFDAFDLNQSGTLERKELHAMLRLGFTEVEEDHVDRVWDAMMADEVEAAKKAGREADPDRISRDGFMRFLRQHEEYLLLFTFLGDESTGKAGSPLPLDRHESFKRRKDSLRRRRVQQ
eukprot:TRINITY_DN2480_c4_g1_i1.p1 TRINITY_DN2480_c4_g1~~TRINITY_DN2480_c4_g1_i1.p1  ORF type:complete len:583 (+),score=166.78 TRINITY_DN2480_c4_g1_i1:118-1866(+)